MEGQLPPKVFIKTPFLYHILVAHTQTHTHRHTQTYRCAVLHHRILHLVAFGDSSREKATLADIIIEVL